MWSNLFLPAGLCEIPPWPLPCVDTWEALHACTVRHYGIYTAMYNFTTACMQFRTAILFVFICQSSCLWMTAEHIRSVQNWKWSDAGLGWVTSKQRERERHTHREIGKNRETSLVILLSFTTVSIWHCGRGLESQVALSVQKPKSVLGDQWRESDGHHPKHVQLTDQRRNWKAAILDADLLPPLFLNAYTSPYDG